jgi:predicted ATPase with chaperone activity
VFSSESCRSTAASVVFVEPIAIETRGKKIQRLIVPEVNAREAAMVSGIEVYPVKSWLDVIHFVNTGNLHRARQG